VMGNYLKTSTEVIAWGGLIFGAAGMIVAVLSYSSNQDSLKLNRELEAHQYLYEAMDLLGATANGPDNLFIGLEPGAPMPSKDQADELEKVRRLLEKYEAIKPNDQNTLLPRFIYYVFWHDLDGAKKVLREKHDNNDDFTDAAVYMFMGLALANRFDNNEQANKYFEKAIYVEPDNADIHAMFGVFLHGIGNNKRSTAMLEKAISMDPDSADSRNGLAHVLSESNKVEESLVVLRKAIRNGVVNASIYNTLGGIYFLQKLYEDSITSFNEAIRRDPTSAVYYHNLSLSLRKLGRTDDAIKAETMRDSLRDQPTGSKALNF